MSLSFAFIAPEVFIKTAIEYAVKRGVLIFAAASNNSNRLEDDIGFPTSMDEVICISSTNYQGVRSSFSPEPDSHSYNLSVIGEMLGAAYPEALNYRPVYETHERNIMLNSSGSWQYSAYSGVYAFPNDISLSSADLADLKTPNGMRRILFECMTKGRHGRVYNDIMPWLLFGNQKPNQDIRKMLHRRFLRRCGKQLTVE